MNFFSACRVELAVVCTDPRTQTASAIRTRPAFSKLKMTQAIRLHFLQVMSFHTWQGSNQDRANQSAKLSTLYQHSSIVQNWWHSRTSLKLFSPTDPPTSWFRVGFLVWHMAVLMSDPEAVFDAIVSTVNFGLQAAMFSPDLNPAAIRLVCWFIRFQLIFRWAPCLSVNCQRCYSVIHILNQCRLPLKHSDQWLKHTLSSCRKQDEMIAIHLSSCIYLRLIH